MTNQEWYEKHKAEHDAKLAEANRIVELIRERGIYYNGKIFSVEIEGRLLVWRFYTYTSPFGCWTWADTGRYFRQGPTPGSDVRVFSDSSESVPADKMLDRFDRTQLA